MYNAKERFLHGFVLRMESNWRNKTIRISLILVLAGIVLAVFCLMVGYQFYGPKVLIETLRGGGDEQIREIIWTLRFSRLMMAFEVGAALALSGLALQSLLKNPLVDPYLIGASSGAAFGAALIMVFIPPGVGLAVLGFGLKFALSAMAFLGALGAITFLYISSFRKGDFSTKRLILMGVVLGAFLSSLVALLIFIRGESIRQVIFWLMGSLENAPSGGWKILGIVLIAGWVFLFTRSWRLNLLSQGESTALGLGVRVASLKREILITSAVLTASAVSMSGVIGFVGLIVPHFFRMIFGPDNRLLIPVTGLGGGILLMAADLLARPALHPEELPIGIITTILGAPFFWLVLKTPAAER